MGSLHSPLASKPTEKTRTEGKRLAIPEESYPGLDPEWRTLWNEFGSHMVRSDEVTLEDYRSEPEKYSFSYPTYSGESRAPSPSKANKEGLEQSADTRVDLLGPDVFRVQDTVIPVSKPAGEIAARIYTPQGPGPFPVHLNFHGGIAVSLFPDRVISYDYKL